MTSSKPGFSSKLLRFSFLMAGLTGFFRLYGAITQYPDIQKFSQEAWLPAYLIAAGGLMGLFNLTIWLLLKRKPRWPAWLAWAGVLMNVSAHWLERQLLWAPTQRGTNATWVIGLHFAWLLLAVISQLQMKRRINEHV